MEKYNFVRLSPPFPPTVLMPGVKIHLINAVKLVGQIFIFVHELIAIKAT